MGCSNFDFCVYGIRGVETDAVEIDVVETDAVETDIVDTDINMYLLINQFVLSNVLILMLPAMLSINNKNESLLFITL